MSEGRFEVSLHHDGSPTCLGYQSNRTGAQDDVLSCIFIVSLYQCLQFHLQRSWDRPGHGIEGGGGRDVRSSVKAISKPAAQGRRDCHPSLLHVNTVAEIWGGLLANTEYQQRDGETMERKGGRRPCLCKSA
jgi:hypothetical protein